MKEIFFTRKEYETLKRLIRETEEKLSQAVQMKGEAAKDQDSWHDEVFKLGVVDEMMWSKRLRELQDLLLKAKVIEPEEQNECVKIGTGVEITYEDGSTRKLLVEGYIVGAVENKVSIYSPLGKILLGSKEGEKKIIKVGETEKVITIKKILPPSQTYNLLSNELEKKDKEKQ